MISCTVCGRENDDLATVCVGCRGFLQSKVDTLDLFQTAWEVVESPGRAFRRIAIARTKNYALFLNALVGCSLAFALAWYLVLGKYFGGLFATLGIGVLIGPPLGLVVMGMAAVLVNTMVRLWRGRVSLRNTFAVLAYAGVPIVLALLFVFPIEIALFGIYLFDKNPSPLVLNPLAYILLLGIDGAAVIWSLVLAGIGIRAAHGLTVWQSVVSPVVLAGLAAAAGIGLRWWR